MYDTYLIVRDPDVGMHKVHNGRHRTLADAVQAARALADGLRASGRFPAADASEIYVLPDGHNGAVYLKIDE